MRVRVVWVVVEEDALEMELEGENKEDECSEVELEAGVDALVEEDLKEDEVWVEVAVDEVADV